MIGTFVSEWDSKTGLRHDLCTTCRPMFVVASVQLRRRRMPGRTGAAKLVAVCKQGPHIARVKLNRAFIGNVSWQIGEIELKAIAPREFVSSDDAVSALRLGQSENG